MLYHRLNLSIHDYQWWNEITDFIHVGGIPLKDNHMQRLKELDVKAVLSIVEDFEFETPGIFGYTQPIDPEDWPKYDIVHQNICCIDHSPLTIEQFEAGTKFIQHHVNLGQRVYIHCKVGVGRSVSMVIAYLMKYHHKTFDLAHNLAQERRPQTNLSYSQVEALEKYYDFLKT